jgi:Ca2+-binding RTX toxin-like protein
VSGNTSLGSYAITQSGDYMVQTDSGGKAIQSNNIESLLVRSYTDSEELDKVTKTKALWNSTEKVLYLYDGGGWSGIGDLSGFSASANFAVVGSAGVDYLNLNIDRSSELTGNMTIAMGDGNDSLGAAKFKDGDSIDMGAGDDSVGIMVTGSNGTPSYAALDITKLDGGAGTDTLSFGNMSSQGSTELTLTHGGVTNFENLSGTGGADIIRGDAGTNVLIGDGGADNIYGGDGNDTLWAGQYNSSGHASTDTTADNLYGGAGDDILRGSHGDNIIDGGAGRDQIINTGNGSDTIVIRSGSGGSTQTTADFIHEWSDGNDKFGLDDGLQYSDLTIAQGTSAGAGTDTSGYENHTVISYGSQYLAVISGVSASSITEADFTVVDIA